VNTDSVAHNLDSDIAGKITIGDGDQPACKTWTVEGEISPDFSYRYDFDEIGPFDDIDGLYPAIELLADLPETIVVRGQPIPGIATPARRLTKRDDKTGDGPTLRAVPRSWAMIDIDSMDCPNHIHFPSDPQAGAEYARGKLPRAFHDVRCIWQASGSAGFKPGIRVHLWFWFDRPVSDAELRSLEWGVRIDLAPFTANQPHFVADPNLDGVADRMAARRGMLSGSKSAVATVELPFGAVKGARNDNGLMLGVGDLKSLADKPRKDKDLSRAIRDLAEGRPYADEGGRNTVSTRLVGAISSEFKNASAESILALFESSLKCWPDGADLRDDIQGMIERWHHPDPTGTPSRISDAFNGKRATPYTAGELSSWAPLDRRWLVQKSSAHYLFFNGSYRGPFTGNEVLSACETVLSPATSIKLWKVTDTREDGSPKWTKKQLAELMTDYGIVATHVEIQLGSNRSYYDTERGTFVEAACPLADLEPAHNPEIAAWLERMVGSDKLVYLLDWMATVTDLNKAAPALYLHGARKAGKGLLVNGLSQLWIDRGPTKLISAMSRFNSGLLDCPLVFGDEKIPSERGLPRTEELRELITDMNQRIERKHLPEIMARGAIRIVLAANNDGLIEGQGVDLTPDDISALADRFIDCEVFDTGITPEIARSWIESKAIARHALWLRDNHRIQTPDRLACRATGAEFSRKLATRTGIRAGLCEFIVRQVFSPVKRRETDRGAPKPLPPVIVDSERVVWANGTLIHRYQSAGSCFTKRQSAAHIQKALRPLCAPTTPRRFGPKEDRGAEYREVQKDLLLAWIEDSDLTSAAEFEAALEAAKLAG
jgi:hypothetical protein